METCLEEGVKLQKKTKEEKKLLRKQLKASHTLLKHEGIDTVLIPTKSLVVANGGLGNGMSREQLLEVLEQCGSLRAVLMPPNKPYAFVTYQSVDAAQLAHKTLNGRQLDTEHQQVTLYLNFVEEVGSVVWQGQELPPGLKVVEEFLSPEEEMRLLGAIDWGSHSNTDTAQKALKHRQVKHYGYEFRYDNNNVDKNKPLPGGLPMFCNEVLDRCLKENLIKVKPDQLTVNQYQPGQGIPPHIDTHSAFEDTIISLSLGAKTVMDFKHTDGRSISVVLPARSVLVMTGESRYLWSHGITPRKFDVVPVGDAEKASIVSGDSGDLTLHKRGTRTSFTFRKVRRTPCDCAFPSVCDSQSSPGDPSSPSVPQSDRDASCLENEFVHKVYEEIASHFSSTRHSPWPRVVDFLQSLPTGAILADVGCGNGKYLGLKQDLFAVGCDRSRNLVDICGERSFQVLVSDALEVPLRSGICDACISIAVIHHFSTKERRLAAIKELVRLLRPGGKALIYVWAMEQEYNKQKSKYLKGKKVNQEEGSAQRPEQTADHLGHSTSLASNHRPAGKEVKDCPLTRQNMSTLSVHTNRTAFHSQDLLVPWHLKSSAPRDKNVGKSLGSADICPIFHRYYHVFCEEELESLCGEVENIAIQTSYYDQGNWCVILEKKSE
ncbi:alkylated DNA repair protein alkB homolog 8 [Lepisosteus oculatus]|uniref:alkylated DNA repair protein alkB homolog 8 n=1 Tax=Lepisosteus oculatus TaxID=7918 RepID=UPI0037148943